MGTYPPCWVFKANLNHKQNKRKQTQPKLVLENLWHKNQFWEEFLILWYKDKI